MTAIALLWLNMSLYYLSPRFIYFDFINPRFFPIEGFFLYPIFEKRVSFVEKSFENWESG